MARKSLCFQQQAGLVERMTFLVLHISLLVGCASFWPWYLQLYTYLNPGTCILSFVPFSGSCYLCIYIYMYILFKNNDNIVPALVCSSSYHRKLLLILLAYW